jgi:hypothetical protein
MTETPYAALIGLDWADQKHDVCLDDCATQTQEHSVIGARPEAIEAWALQLRMRYGGQPIAVCLELLSAFCSEHFTPCLSEECIGIGTPRSHSICICVT